MTDAECAETLAEFRKLTLGPELSAAMDWAIYRLSHREPALALGPLISPTDGRPYSLPYSTDLREHSAKAAMQ